MSNTAMARPIVTRLMLRRCPIIYYHYVGPERPHTRYCYEPCSVDKFRAQLTQLSQVFRFTDLHAVLTDGPPRRGKPPLAVTFDDGLDLEQSGAAQVIDDFGIKATNFLVTDCVDNQSLMWRSKISAAIALAGVDRAVAAYNAVRCDGPRAATFDELWLLTSRWRCQEKDELAENLWAECGLGSTRDYLAEYAPYMSWDGIARWRAQGHDVGLHTASHPDCSLLTRDDVKKEILAPAEDLKQRLQRDWLAFSYPFGERLPADLEAETLAKAKLACMLGIRGFSWSHSDLTLAERAHAEAEIAFSVFGKTAVTAILAPVQQIRAVAERVLMHN